jgi:L-iditol 2-dehydrogenase
MNPSLPTSMRAAVYRGPGSIEFVDLPVPVPAADEVLLRVRACGVCGSDVHRIRHGTAFPGVVLGHEWVGEVVAAGPEVADLAPGDRVVPGNGPGGGRGTPSPNDPPPAGSERRGARARHSPRDNGRTCFPGTNAQGGFAHYLLRRRGCLGRVPAGMDDARAIAAEPLAVAINAVQQSGVRLGSRVAVFGLGAIGQFVVQAARLQGAGRIIAVDPDPARRALARRCGAEVVIDPTAEDTQDAVVTAAGDAGPEVVIECAGAPDTLQTALESVTWGGTVVMVAVRWTETALVPVDWIGRAPRLIASYAYGSAWGPALDLLARGQVSIDGLMDRSCELPLERLMDAITGGGSGVVKPVILPHGGWLP